MVQDIDPVAFSAFEKQAWRQSATAYDRYFGPLTAQTGSRLLDAVAEQPEGKALLDVATGPGYLAKQAATRGFSKVVGLDFSDPMIALAKATGPGNAEFRVGDAQNLVEEGDCSFDAVTMNFGLLHMSLTNVEIRPCPCLRGRRSFISAIAPTVLVRCTLLVFGDCVAEEIEDSAGEPSCTSTGPRAASQRSGCHADHLTGIIRCW